MPQLRLFNTLTREKQLFTPLELDANGNVQSVRMYVCGITPYDYAHIGNLRTMVTFDVLYRLLNHLYPGKVMYVRNYTDIDDKIVQRAAEEGKEPFALAAEYIEIFERDMANMNILDLPREQKPRVSDYLREIVAMVDGLLHKGAAYITASGDVMLDVQKFNQLGAPHDTFGFLERRTFDNLQARVEEDAEKRDPRDFPIWKANSKSATKLEQAFMPAELGATYSGFTAAGRPGWHIECSVMSEATLGKNYRPGHAALFDIHGGGEDLKFPHHSCEIAQTESFRPECTMSSIWMHAAFLTVDGQKMSKSLNNFTTIEDALKKYSPEAIRLWLLQTHYRKPVDYSDEALQAASASILRVLKPEANDADVSDLTDVKAKEELVSEFLEAMYEDLNTAKALSVLHKAATSAQKLRNGVSKPFAVEEHRSILAAINLMTSILGLKFKSRNENDIKLRSDMLNAIDEVSGAIEDLLQMRVAARAAKNYPESDRLREELKKHGILVEDGPTGQTWRRT